MSIETMLPGVTYSKTVLLLPFCRSTMVG